MALFNTDRLSRSERKKLRELRRAQKAKGLKKRSHSGLTAAQSIEKRKLENKRRQARMDDFGKAVIGAAAGGLGAALGGAGAAGAASGAGSGTAGGAAGTAGATGGLTATGGSGMGAVASQQALIGGLGTAGATGAGAGLGTAGTAALAGGAGAGTSIASSALSNADKIAKGLETADKAIKTVSKGKKVYDSLKGTQDTPLEEESFDDPSPLEQALDDPSFAEFGSEGVDEFPTRPPSGMGMEAILQDLSKRNMPSIQAGPIFNQVTGGRKRKTSDDEELQYRMDEFMKRLGGFNQPRGLAGLGNTFRTGGRIKVKKKY